MIESDNLPNLPMEIIYEILRFIPRDRTIANFVPTDVYIELVVQFKWLCHHSKTSDEPNFLHWFIKHTGCNTRETKLWNHFLRRVRYDKVP